MARYELHALVPNGPRTAVLVAAGALPRVCVAGEDRVVPHALEALRRQHGVAAPFLRALAVVERGDEGGAVLLELDAPVPSPPGEWLPVERLGELPLAPKLATAAAEWVAGLRAPVPPGRAPWARPGWRAEAERWIRDALPEAGAIDLVRQWPLSCLLRVEAPGRSAYFKAVFALFHHEPAVTEALALEHPRLVPEVLATDHERGWMLMLELGRGEPRPLDEAQRDDALRALAAVHRAWEGRRARLVGLGAPDRSLDVLVDELPAALAGVGLDDSAVPELQRRARELTGFALPETLVHGDFHAGNAVEHEGRVVLIDWSDACFAHPLFDLLTFVPGFGAPMPPQVLDTYAAARGDVPAADLRRAFAVAEPLACVHHLLSYLRIGEALEPGDRDLFAEVPRHFVERALALL